MNIWRRLKGEKVYFVSFMLSDGNVGNGYVTRRKVKSYADVKSIEWEMEDLLKLGIGTPRLINWRAFE